MAERLQAPVATSVAAKGVFSDHHPLCLGAVYPPYRPLTSTCAPATWCSWPVPAGRQPALAEATPLRTVRIDVEPRSDAEVTIQADAGWALEQLAARLDGGGAPVPPTAPGVVGGGWRGCGRSGRRRASKLQPQRSLTEALRAALPEDGILGCTT